MDLSMYEVKVEEYMRGRCGQHVQVQQKLLERPIAFDYRYEHTRTAVRIAGQLAEELGVNPALARIATWLHDIAKCWDPDLDAETNRRREVDHGPVGGQEAAEYLRSLDFPAGLIAQVEQAIANHVGFLKDYTLEDPLDAVVWDADKLSKISIAGIIHYLCKRLYKASDVLDLEQYFANLDRELHRGIRDSLNTDVARVWADRELAATDGLHQQILTAMVGKRPNVMI